MSTPTHVEVTDVSWFAGYGPAAPKGPCRHRCAHRHTSVIAWGPSQRLYELVQCDDVCGGECRAWQAATPTSNGGIPNSHPYVHVGRQERIR